MNYYENSSNFLNSYNEHQKKVKNIIKGLSENKIYTDIIWSVEKFCQQKKLYKIETIHCRNKENKPSY